MDHPVHHVTGFEQLDTYILRVEFEDGTEQMIDFAPVLHGKLYGRLRDPQEFARVRIDPDSRTLVWPSGADFDPADLHDWPQVAEEFARRARAWESVGTSPSESG